MKYGNLKKNNFEIIIEESENEFKTFSFINGLYIFDGTHIDYILNKILPGIKNKFKKLKNLKNNDIKQKIKIYVGIKNFKNMEFDSQTKERLTNSKKDLDEFFNNENVDWNKIINNTYKELKESIELLYSLKEKEKEKKELKKLKNKSKKIISEKYTPSIGLKKYLFLTEGTSANSFLMKALGRKNFGYIEMMGVPLNVENEKISKVANSKKFEDIQKVCGIDYVNNFANCDYEKIIIATDADIFGYHIAGLVSLYFYKFAKNIIKERRLGILKTPIVMAFDKKGKLQNYFFDLKDYKEFEKNNKNLIYEYNKGLGSNDEKYFKEIVKKEELENLIYYITEEEIKENLFWFNNEVEKRKKIIKENPFNINLL